MNSITRGIKNTFRNSIRTLSVVVILALTIGLALSMAIARTAVTAKINSVKSSVGNTISISPAGVRGFEGGGNPLTDDQINKLSKIAHVTAINKTLNDRLTSSTTTLQSAVDAGSLGNRFSQNSGQRFTPPENDRSSNGDGAGTVSFTPPVTLLGTTTPTDLSSSQGSGTFTLKSGTVFSGTSNDNSALIGSSIATKNNLKVGSTFTAYDTTITVVGIFDAGNTFSNNQVLMPLASVQRLSSQSGDITNATVTVDSITNIDSTTTAIKNSLGSTADVTNSSEQAKESITPLQNIQTISLYSLIGSVAAGGIIILLTMVMIVRERRREIGVLKAIGASNSKIVKQFMAEAVTFTLLGAFVGLGIGAIAGQPLTKLLVTNSQNSTSTSSQTQAGAGPREMGGFSRMSRFGRIGNNISDIKTTLGLSTIGYGLGAALVIALFGSAISALLIAKIRPAEVMRTE